MRFVFLLKSAGFGFATLRDWAVPAGQCEDASARSHILEPDSDEDAVVESDPAHSADADEKGKRLHYYQLHIVYSLNYQVPVLYFNGQSSGT